MLFAEAAAGRLEIPAGAVLLLEDVTETSYRIDRMLSALSAGGYFAKIAAVVLGEFVDCSPGKFDVPASKVLAEHLIRLGVPVLAGLPVGHAKRNRPLVIGGETLVDAASGTLSVDGPASA